VADFALEYRMLYVYARHFFINIINMGIKISFFSFFVYIINQIVLKKKFPINKFS
jgi:hypothetical protein